MAREVCFRAPTTTTGWKFIIVNYQGRYWNTNSSVFEVPTSGNYTLGYYYTAATEDAGTANFVGTFPAGMVTGDFTIIPIQQVGGAANALNDIALGSFTIKWDGSNHLELFFASDIYAGILTIYNALTLPTADVVLLYNLLVMSSSLCQAGSTNNTIILAADAPSIDDYFKGKMIMVATGTHQIRQCIAYNGTTKELTVDSDWASNPSTSTLYIIGTTSMPVLNADGDVSIDPDQVIPVDADPNTLADCLNAARVQGRGKWIIDKDANTLTTYNHDNTVLDVYDLAPNANRPISRTPQT